MAFEELKERQSVMWGNGAYERISATLAEAQEDIVAALAPQAGERWLDVATGTGAVALIAARQGADVTGVDLAPALVETARRHAAEAGLDVRFDVGDAERLPYDDASFDVAVSTYGVMFAPDHQAVAHELARVVRPGGRLGLACWLGESGVGDMFRVMRPFQPAPPPEGVGNPFDWGREEYVRALLGDAFELEFAVRDSVYRPATPEAAWEEFSSAYGPTRTLAESLDEERAGELARAWVELYAGYRTDDGVEQHRLYLRTIATRR